MSEEIKQQEAEFWDWYSKKREKSEFSDKVWSLAKAYDRELRTNGTQSLYEAFINFGLRVLKTDAENSPSVITSNICSYWSDMLEKKLLSDELQNKLLKALKKGMLGQGSHYLNSAAQTLYHSGEHELTVKYFKAIEPHGRLDVFEWQCWALSEEDSKDGLKVLERAISEYPDSDTLLCLRGEMLQNMGCYKKAIKQFDAVIQKTELRKYHYDGEYAQAVTAKAESLHLQQKHLASLIEVNRLFLCGKPEAGAAVKHAVKVMKDIKKGKK